MKTLKINLIAILTILTTLFSCSEIKVKEQANNKGLTPTLQMLKVNDYSKVILTVERGAFHYDKFILEDTLIRFYPKKKEVKSSEKNKYSKISKQAISSKERDAPNWQNKKNENNRFYQKVSLSIYT